MRQLPAVVRPWIYFVAGSLVGFVLLGEFALGTLVPVQIGLLAFAVVGTIGAARGSRGLEPWPAFVAAAEIAPLTIASHIVGLPHCDTVGPAVPCFAGTRDAVTPFAIGLMALVVAVGGMIVFFARAPSRNVVADS